MDKNAVVAMSSCCWMPRSEGKGYQSFFGSGLGHDLPLALMAVRHWGRSRDRWGSGDLHVCSWPVPGVAAGPGLFHNQPHGEEHLRHKDAWLCASDVSGNVFEAARKCQWPVWGFDGEVRRTSVKICPRFTPHRFAPFFAHSEGCREWIGGKAG